MTEKTPKRKVRPQDLQQNVPLHGPHVAMPDFNFASRVDPKCAFDCAFVSGSPCFLIRGTLWPDLRRKPWAPAPSSSPSSLRGCLAAVPGSRFAQYHAHPRSRAIPHTLKHAKLRSNREQFLKFIALRLTPVREA